MKKLKFWESYYIRDSSNSSFSKLSSQLILKLQQQLKALELDLQLYKPSNTTTTTTTTPSPSLSHKSSFNNNKSEV